MKDLHNILGDLIDVAADIENLRTVLKVIEQSAEVGEGEVRAGLNLTMLSLASLKGKLDCGINALDTFLLENWKKETSSVPV